MGNRLQEWWWDHVCDVRGAFRRHRFTDWKPAQDGREYRKCERCNLWQVRKARKQNK